MQWRPRVDKLPEVYINIQPARIEKDKIVNVEEWLVVEFG